MSNHIKNVSLCTLTQNGLFIHVQIYLVFQLHLCNSFIAIIRAYNDNVILGNSFSLGIKGIHRSFFIQTVKIYTIEFSMLGNSKVQLIASSFTLRHWKKKKIFAFKCVKTILFHDMKLYIYTSLWLYTLYIWTCKFVHFLRLSTWQCLDFSTCFGSLQHNNIE